MNHSFPKQEKLCGQLRISSLYKQSKRMVCWPVRVNYQFEPAEKGKAAVEVLIWAPKSIFHHAVDRNRMRRLMREAYRLHAAPLRQHCVDKQVRLLLALNYIDKELQPYSVVERGVQKALKKLIQA